MYTLGARSRERRSTQTAMYIMCEGLATLLAPILPVTADDLWRHVPGARSTSVHLEDCPRVDGLIDTALLEEWDGLLGVREQVNAALEQKRKDKIIGTSLGARVVLTARGPVAALLDRHRTELPMLLNVSEVALTTKDAASDGSSRQSAETATPGLPRQSTESATAGLPRQSTEGATAGSVEIRVDKAPGVKCARCWRFVPAVRNEPEWAGICDRCVEALAEPVNS
jgi:isoleucyl-tRNA synthetase